MKVSLYLLFVMVFSYGCSPTFKRDSKRTTPDFDLAIENVKVFDSKNKTIMEGKTILINGDSIVAVVNSSQKVIANKRIVGQGRLVVPGFIDTHMHLSHIYGDGANGHQEVLENNDLFRRVLSDQYLAYGTTTIMDMGQYEAWMDVSLDWQKNTEPNYPNLFITGQALISYGGKWPYTYKGYRQISDEDDAKRTVVGYDKKGIRHIKLYKMLRGTEMKAVVDEAKKHKIPVYAHTDLNVVTISQAMDLGVRNFEHFFTLVPSVLNMDELWPTVKEKYNLKDQGSIDEFSAKMIFFFQYIKDTPELSDQLDRLIEMMVRKNATISSTIHPLASAAGKNYPGSFSSFNSFPLRSSAFLPNYTAAKKQELKKAFDIMMQVLKKAHDKGVKIRIGTDCRYGGKALLSELMLMYEAHFKMEDILQIATWNGAEAMHIMNTHGSIEKGKKADLVLFDKNPFDDYKNLIGTKTIVKGGKIFVPKKSVTSKVLEVIKTSGIESGIEWFRNYNEKSIRGDEVNEVGFELIKEGKISDAIAVFKYKDATYDDGDKFYNNLLESYTYPTGYHLIKIGKISDAILLYKYTTERFPESGYANYSLAETYMADGKKQLAIPLYKKAIKLAPESGYVKEIQNKLKEIE